jgi:hypothetical protein
MAAVNVTIVGTLSYGSMTIPGCTMVGQAYLTDLGVGGGPIIPGGHPEHPIWGPPGMELPPGPGFPPVAGHPLPIPPVDTIPPPPGGEKPPPADGGWGYWGDPVNSWVYKPGPGQASPKPAPTPPKR